MSIRNTISIHRGIVIRSSSQTGDVFVKIPEILGDKEAITVSRDFIYEGPDGWVVPDEGSQILVGLEGDLVRNVYIINELKTAGSRLSHLAGLIKELDNRITILEQTI
jgi:hypothetical protein